MSPLTKKQQALLNELHRTCGNGLLRWSVGWVIVDSRNVRGGVWPHKTVCGLIRRGIFRPIYDAQVALVGGGSFSALGVR